MTGRDITALLSESAFLTNVDERDRKAWRIALTVVAGLVVGVIAVFAVFAVIAVGFVISRGGVAGLTDFGVFMSNLQNADGHDLSQAILLLLMPTLANGPLVLTFLVLAAALSHHRMRDYLTSAPQFRWKLLAAGMVMSFLAIGPLLGLDALVEGTSTPMPLMTVSADLQGRAVYAVCAVALLIPAALIEEVLFRGWMLRQTAAFQRNPFFLMIFTGLAFSAVHMDFNLDAFIARTIMGAGFAYMTLRLGGLEFSTGAHAANNILIVIFLEPLTLKASAGGGMSVASVVQDALLVAGYVLITEAVARIPWLRRWTEVRDEELSGGAAHPAALFS
ncbi:CPBP family intramembrane glutamic endopeptidase [Caulobacter sp. KR2-114]|uniref:CPBP family intramembrane glutamic endopeptidase n=1 Tax=Caulobacter sp. KR2-114 TaxID=3400912 RepID=UPI003C03C321